MYGTSAHGGPIRHGITLMSYLSRALDAGVLHPYLTLKRSLSILSWFPLQMGLRGTISPYVEPTPNHLGRRPQTFSPMNIPSSPPHRSSALPSILPLLRRSDTKTGMATHSKPPLLTLKLSSTCFLESFLHDELSKDHLYTIQTTGSSTTVTRSTQWKKSIVAAEIKWPKSLPARGKSKDSDGVVIRMGGARWDGADSFLRPGLFQSAPRKFNIPNYSQSLKWRRVGTSYWCTTADVNGPIATFEPAISPNTAGLRVYETLHDKHDARMLDVHHGVSTLLLDYLVLTSLMLVTEAQDWRLVKKFDEPTPRRLDALDSTNLSSSPSGSTTSHWRKLLHSEPLYRMRSLHVSSLTKTELVPSTPTTADQLNKIAFGMPLYPKRTRAPSPSFFSSDSESEDDDDDDDDIRQGLPIRNAISRPPSPSAESMAYSWNGASAPSHTYLDPSFYGDDVPPVPPIPPQYTKQNTRSTRSLLSRPSSPLSIHSNKRRELPTPPESQTPLPSSSRPQSTEWNRTTPALSPTSPGRRLSQNPRARSLSSRPLPQIPNAGPRIVRQAHSHARLRPTNSPTEGERRRSQTASGRSLPPTPIGSPSTSVEDVHSTSQSTHRHVADQPHTYDTLGQRQYRHYMPLNQTNHQATDSRMPHHHIQPHGNNIVLPEGGNRLYYPELSSPDNDLQPPPAYDSLFNNFHGQHQHLPHHIPHFATAAVPDPSIPGSPPPPLTPLSQHTYPDDDRPPYTPAPTTQVAAS